MAQFVNIAAIECGEGRIDLAEGNGIGDPIGTDCQAIEYVLGKMPILVIGKNPLVSNTLILGAKIEREVLSLGREDVCRFSILLWPVTWEIDAVVCLGSEEVTLVSATTIALTLEHSNGGARVKISYYPLTVSEQQRPLEFPDRPCKVLIA